MDKNCVTLAIAHHIHLTRDERYRVFNGEIVETTAVSIPVWHYQGKTSEPAKEIFCHYIITNWSDAEEGVRQNVSGYEINLPQEPKNIAPNIRLTDDEWRKLTEPYKKAYYHSLEFPVTAMNLLDLKDGGSACMSFNQYNKITLTANGIHFVRIEDISLLTNSIF